MLIKINQKKNCREVGDTQKSGEIQEPGFNTRH